MRNLTANENLIVGGGNTAVLGLTLMGIGIALMATQPYSTPSSYSYNSYPSYQYSRPTTYQTVTPFCDWVGCGYAVDTYW